ncbi:MAG: PfkB family carbohydrate kinase [Pyrinomonadaceae bacterium]
MTRTILQERLISIVKRFPNLQIAVVGDAIADQFVYGAISRVSREAPVFILRHEQTETVPGGAANCAVNLASLGAAVSLIGIAGADTAGRALLERLEQAGVDCGGLLIVEDMQTTTKVRILAGQLHSTRQQVIRIDYEGTPLANRQQQALLRDRAVEAAQGAAAVVISDYNYGVASGELADALRPLALSKKCPVLVDSRFELSRFSGFTSATPNEDEVEQLLQATGDFADLESAGERLRENLGYRALLITRGGHGMILLEDGVAPLRIAAVGGSEPVDVTGAGDTVMATYSLALAAGASFSDAAHLANHAGGIVVMKRGTAAITPVELEHSIVNTDTN